MVNTVSYVTKEKCVPRDNKFHNVSIALKGIK